MAVWQGWTDKCGPGRMRPSSVWHANRSSAIPCARGAAGRIPNSTSTKPQSMVEKGLPTPQRPSFVAQKSPPCALRCAGSTRASFPATPLCLLSIRLSLGRAGVWSYQLGRRNPRRVDRDQGRLTPAAPVSIDHEGTTRSDRDSGVDGVAYRGADQDLPDG